MPSEEIDGVVISSFPNASTIENNDVVTGLHNGNNANFLFSGIAAYIRQGLSNIFVPWSRIGTPNGAASLDSSGKVPGTQLDLSDKQDEITASGILKGDGAGGVSAATPGTDYGTYSKPSGGIPASDLANGVIPAVPSAYTSNPAMDGTASPGSSGAWAKGDHVHPSDTSKANQAQLAYVETGTTASRNYSAGQPICWNGLFYTADINIVSGATLSASGGSKNLTETTIGNLLYTSIGYASSSASISSVTGTIVRVGVNYIFNLQIVVGTAIARFIPLVEFSAPTSVRTTVTNPAVWIVNHQAAGTQYAGFVSYANSKHVITSSTQLPVGTYSVYAVVTMM